jgi:hypothetical protein
VFGTQKDIAQNSVGTARQREENSTQRSTSPKDVFVEKLLR